MTAGGQQGEGLHDELIQGEALHDELMHDEALHDEAPHDQPLHDQALTGAGGAGSAQAFR